MQRARNHYPQVASPKNKIRKEVFQALIDDIRHYNKRLSEFVVLKRKQASNLLTLSKTPSTLVAASTHTLGSRNPRIISTMLYEALSKCATCNCHELYLRLETSEEPDNQQSPNRDILSDSNNPHPLIRFSLLIADKNTSASSGPPNKYLLLGIVSASSSSTLISENMSQRKPILCARELKNIINENKYFLEGFLVYESSHNGATTRDIGIRKSLKQLLKEIPGNDILRKLDLGGSLGNAAIQFHSSPWIKFWDTETVTMFASHNKNLPSVGESLIPHILSVPKLVEHSATCNIGDLYQLGLMLLEVAGEDSTKFHIRLKVSGLDYISQPNWTLVDSLVRKVGRPYKNFVRRCFEIGWSLPDSGCACEDDLDKLFKDLKEIDKLASNFRRCL
ncbi:hypothetical protein EDC01DRAFT_88387 [Geopyxis carbonaria]|nr:hypothetical protein EDC01DRAFT_88387 [Geopyxis carbonaria]